PKGIHYRMHPANVRCLTVVGVDCCVLANNHVLDWGTRGLIETLDTLAGAGLKTAGAGRDFKEASQPAILLGPPRARILVFAAATADSGAPKWWAASDTRAGVFWLPDLSIDTADFVSQQIRSVRQNEDLVIFSIHWGENWGYEIPADQHSFAHRLIERGAADVIYGHSSHHPK